MLNSYTPDWAANESRKDADRYSALASCADDTEAAINVCAAIRRIPHYDLSPAVVRQILNTLACRMADSNGFSDTLVATIDDTAENF